MKFANFGVNEIVRWYISEVGEEIGKWGKSHSDKESNPIVPILAQQARLL